MTSNVMMMMISCEVEMRYETYQFNVKWKRTLPQKVNVGVDSALHPQQFRHMDAGEYASAEAGRCRH